MTTWDILIPSVAHRTDKLTLLLSELASQMQPGVGVRVFRDNLEHSQAFKCQALLDSSIADYVSFIEDDDWIHENYVGLIMGALELDPDFVGFGLRYTENGVLQLPIVHSYNSVQNEIYPGQPPPEVLYRRVTHLNPIRRTIAVTARFDGDFTMDRRWSQEIIRGGLIQSEVLIDEQVYHYRHDHSDSIQSGPYTPVERPPVRPDFDWVVWL